MRQPTRELVTSFLDARHVTEALCEPLCVEDFVVQTMPDVSPIKWHLAHTTWFFETFVLRRCQPDAAPFHPAYNYLFNSYYNRVGPQFPRPERGLLSRPTVDEVFAYRAHVDGRMRALLAEPVDAATESLTQVGVHHEQQHQELMLTDIKHIFGTQPLEPVYRSGQSVQSGGKDGEHSFVAFHGGTYAIGHGGEGFAFDNEGPRHERLLASFELGSRLVTCAEFLNFIEDGGYQRPELWLSEGWAAAQRERWKAPRYWRHENDGWTVFTLGGRRALQAREPVCHVSYFEADAYATWAGARLPDEAEWEVAARQAGPGNFVESGALHPRPAAAGNGLKQMFGDLWEWTRSAYAPYPRYRPPAGAVGEYNGKFMCGQYVLRGGSCATSARHIRPTYRNFFPPDARWQFTGIRLARD
ncbi:MAG: ergothioneine biosynthesis protein EgtB [Myxococcota bacterium]